MTKVCTVQYLNAHFDMRLQLNLEYVWYGDVCLNAKKNLFHLWSGFD